MNNSRFKKFAGSFVLLCFFICASFFSLTSCGKKGPPMPSRQTVLPCVSMIDKTIVDENTLLLTWTLPNKKPGKKPDKKKEIKNIDGFFVYRSKVLLSESECKDCPVLFKKMADISNKNQKEFEYMENLEKGYKYIYKINAYDKKGLLGKDSNTVEFTY